MHTHKHRKSNAAWERRFGDAGGLSASGYNFHGYCNATGAHLVTEVCTCGAKLYVCPSASDRPERRSWIGNETQE